MGANKAQTSKPLTSDPEKLFVKMIRHNKIEFKILSAILLFKQEKAKMMILPNNSIG